MIEITVPRLGWSMDEGVFVEWLVRPGEFVNSGDSVFELEGEKAVQEVESFDSGILCVPSDAPGPGDTVQVGQVVGFLLTADEDPPTSVGPATIRRPTSDNEPSQTESLHSRPSTPPSAAPEREVRPTSIPERVAGPAARRLARQLGIDLNAVTTPDPTGRVDSGDVLRAQQNSGAGTRKPAAGSRLRSSPRARRRARELGVNWQLVRGTGRHGRIRERDVVAFAQAQQSTAPVDQSHARRFRAPRPAASGQHVPASQMRKTIAQRMSDGIHQAAPVTLTTKVMASELVELRRQYRAADADNCPGYNDILIRLSAITLKEQPDLNACWYDDGIWSFRDINIAMAVDTEDGLLAPVIPNADQLSVRSIAKQSLSLIEKARSGTLSRNDLQGGTFTVTSLGMFGIDAFTPVLNLPQSAILGIGRIHQEPVVCDDRVAVGETLTLSLTFDHRVIDGAPAARWLQRLSQRIETVKDVLQSE